jgi:hypothetical protein
LGNLPSAILWTWLYHVSWFCSISFIIVPSSLICCLIVTFHIDLMFKCVNGLQMNVSAPANTIYKSECTRTQNA